MAAPFGTGGQQLSFPGDVNPIGGGGMSALLGNNPALLAQIGAGTPGGGDPFTFQGALTQTGGNLGSEAGQLYNTGLGLVDPLVSGKLPPGAEQSVQNAIKQAQTTIKGRYGSLGQTGSTMEGDALANIENQATQMRFQIAEDMAKTGLQATSQSITALGLESGIYEKLMEAQMKQDQSMSSTIGNFAGALGQGIGLLGKGGMFAGAGAAGGDAALGATGGDMGVEALAGLALL